MTERLLCRDSDWRRICRNEQKRFHRCLRALNLRRRGRRGSYARHAPLVLSIGMIAAQRNGATRRVEGRDNPPGREMGRPTGRHPLYLPLGSLPANPRQRSFRDLARRQQLRSPYIAHCVLIVDESRFSDCEEPAWKTQGLVSLMKSISDDNSSLTLRCKP